VVRARSDVRTVPGDGTTRGVLRQAGVPSADLVIACSAREEVNLICAMLVKRLSSAQAVVLASSAAYLEAWAERELDVDFMVSSEVETANAISAMIGIPAARQTDVFAEGRVQMVEFDVPEGHPTDGVVGVPLKQARLPVDSKVASIIRGNRVIIARGADVIAPGDRIVVIGSPDSAREWSELVEGNPRIQAVTIVGTRKTGAAAARELGDRGVHVRLIEADGTRARELAAALPRVRVIHGDGTDVDVLAGESIGHSDAVVCALGRDADNLMAGVLSRQMGVPLVIGIVNHPRAIPVFEGAGFDVALNPQAVTAEEILRFTRDPRTQAMAILEGGGAEVIEIEVRAQSRLIGVPFRQLPVSDSFIGAIVRGEDVIFPHGDDHLEGGDRVVIFTRAGRVDEIEEAL
jgi:trk system potassium uptake protein